MNLAPATREDVMRCYDVLLGRNAESDAILETHLLDAPSIWQLVERFCTSPEFKRKTSSLTLAKCEREYLLKNLDVKARRACLLHHHTFIVSRLKSDVVDGFYQGRRYSLGLPASRLRGREAAIYLGCPAQYFFEGEMELHLEYQDVRVFTTSFSFAPGRILGVADENVILITRMQGELGRKEEMRNLAANALGTSPQLILHSALVGIARASGITTILGASAGRQICNTSENDRFMMNAYDLFYQSFEAERLDCGIFLIDLNKHPKPIDESDTGKRRRHKLRRRLRESFSQSSASSWLDISMSA